MSKPQDHEQCDDDSVEDDLKILQEMDIDQDFNSWGTFRNSIAVQGKRESLDSLVKRKSSKSSYRSPRVSESQSGQSGASQDMYNISENSSCSFETGEMEKDFSHRSGDKELNVSFSALTSGEKRDLRGWNMRLAKDTVFSRYYFPEAWETREMKTIEKFIELENPHESPWFFNKPGQEATKAAIASVFYPGDHDPKSVLLKRGPVLLDAVAERELLLFTHGFFIARIEFDNFLNILFTINSENPQYLNSKQLKDRFDAIDSDNSGSLDRCELKEVFSSMGVPIGESALSDIISRFDGDNDGTIDFDEFESVMRELEPKPKEEDRWSLDSIGKKLKDSFLSVEAERKLDLAFQFSDIEKVESINACYSEPTEMFVDSSWAELIFAIYVKGREDPLIMVCSKPEHRLAWVDAFRTCYVKSTMLKCQSGFRDAKKICDRVGWQHRAIRASLFSLVVCNDLAGLQEQISNPSEDMEDIDDQDEYHGFTALHYAAALGRMDCARILVKYKARMNVQDNDQMTPLDHATLSDNKAMMQLLEHHGAKKHTTAEVLFKSALEEQEKMKSEKSPTSGAKTVAKAKQAAGAMSHAVSALRERGERLERLDDKTAQLQSDASNYADMAKKMKEKNKKKANRFGMY